MCHPLQFNVPRNAAETVCGGGILKNHCVYSPTPTSTPVTDPHGPVVPMAQRGESEALIHLLEFTHRGELVTSYLPSQVLEPPYARSNPCKPPLHGQTMTPKWHHRGSASCVRVPLDIALEYSHTRILDVKDKLNLRYQCHHKSIPPQHLELGVHVPRILSLDQYEYRKGFHIA